MADKMLKLYDKAPAESLAALMVGAAFRGDTDEAKTLWSAVIKDGNSPRYERFRRRRESLVLVTMLWANECLRTQANMTALSASIASGDLAGREVLVFDALHRRYQLTLSALITAMDEFAAEVGLDLEAVKVLATVDLRDFDCEVTAPRAMVDALMEQYRGLVS